MVCRACRLCDVWSHVTWSIANEIEVKESHEQRCDLVLKSGMTPMTQKTSSKRAILTYMEMCSLKRKFKLITCVTSEVRSRQSSSLQMTACESKPIRCIVFVKAMANITNRGKVSPNYHLLFLYSQFTSTILRDHPWPHWQNFSGPTPTFPQPFIWFRLCGSSKDNVPG